MRMLAVPLIVCTFAAAVVGCSGGGGSHKTPKGESEPVYRLDLSTPPTQLAALGTFEVETVEPHSLWFAPSAGDLCDPVRFDRETLNFNFDGLYRAAANGNEYYFRFGAQDCSSGQTVFRYVQWANGVRPSPGLMNFEVVEKAITDPGDRTLVTIGDSITWARWGQALRVHLDDLKPEYRYIGSRTDTFGYGHDGEGGDSTSNVLARLSWIPAADAYLLNIGTNDGSAEDSAVQNIQQIVYGLQQKQSGALVYLCTLLPRSDSWDDRNQRISGRLREWAVDQPNVVVVDLDREWRTIPNWQSYLPDGIHPSASGYKRLAAIIADYL